MGSLGERDLLIAVQDRVLGNEEVIGEVLAIDEVLGFRTSSPLS